RSSHGGLASTGKAADLKSAWAQALSGFESPALRHFPPTLARDIVAGHGGAMVPGLLIVSVYHPDIYKEALGAIGLARDVSVVLDRRVGERRRRAPDEASQRLDRRPLHRDEAPQTHGGAGVSQDDDDALTAAGASRRALR